MAEPISLVFGDVPTKIGTITLDASLKETHTGESDVTEHPVEQGANITDHVRPRPSQLTIEGVVSNTPINSTQQSRVVDVLGVPFETTSLSDQIQGVAGYAEQAYAVLEEFRRNGTVLTVVTRLRTYDNMILSSLSIPRDKQTGDALFFTASFKQIILVTSRTVRIVVAKTTKAQGKNKAGVQVGKPATLSKSEGSTLFNLDESLNGGLSKLLKGE